MSKQHIELTLNKIQSIFEKASAKIDALSSGQKLLATKLAEEIGKEYNIPGPVLYPTLKLLLDNYPGVSVKRGAHGGIIKL